MTLTYSAMKKYDKETIDQVNASVNVVDYASQYLDLQESKGEHWAICPFHNDDSDPSLSMNREQNVFYCFSCGVGGSTLQFVQNYHKKAFPKAIEYLIDYGNVDVVQKEHSEVYNFLHKRKSVIQCNTVVEREYLPDNYIDRYAKKPITEWLDEGITQEVLDKYEVRYDKNNNSIVFPIRDVAGRIIAIKSRTLYPNHKDLGIPKYIYYQKIITSDFLFGLYQNYQNIKDKNEVIVLEGAKGVMLAESYGYNNVVSLETSKINSHQKNLLLQLKCNITFALDKGVKISTTKSKNNSCCIGLLPKMTNVYVVEDRQNLIDDKDSPVDKGKEVWQKLYESRYKI